MHLKLGLSGVLALVLACTSLSQRHAAADTLPPAPGWIDYTGAAYITPTGTDRWHVPIGFDFAFYGASNLVTSDAYAQSHGYLGLGPEPVNNVDLRQPENWPYSSWQELRSRIVSPLGSFYNYNWPFEGRIYYETVGEEGQRIFAVTWDTYLDAGKTQQVVFQSQLHEASGRIQFSYAQIPDELIGARVGINYGDGVEYTGFWYEGWSNYDGGGTQNANQYGPQGNLAGWSIYYDWNPDSGTYDVSQQNIPEPSTMAMLLTGLGVSWLARRRQKQAG